MQSCGKAHGAAISADRRAGASWAKPLRGVRVMPCDSRRARAKFPEPFEAAEGDA
jgi:hypothetical protein